MPPTTQITARVDPAVRETLQGFADSLFGGNLTSALEFAVQVWADALDRAGAENAQAIRPEEWCLIADVCNGTLWDYRGLNPGVLLAAEISDGHRLDGTGYKWLGTEGTKLAGALHRTAGGKPTAATKAVDKQVADLVKQLAALDHAHAWAVILAVTWFWQHTQDNIDARSDPWWSPQWRREFEAQKEEDGDA